MPSVVYTHAPNLAHMTNENNLHVKFDWEFFYSYEFIDNKSTHSLLATQLVIIKITFIVSKKKYFLCAVWR